MRGYGEMGMWYVCFAWCTFGIAKNSCFRVYEYKREKGKERMSGETPEEEEWVVEEEEGSPKMCESPQPKRSQSMLKPRPGTARPEEPLAPEEQLAQEQHEALMKWVEFESRFVQQDANTHTLAALMEMNSVLQRQEENTIWAAAKTNLDPALVARMLPRRARDSWYEVLGRLIEVTAAVSAAWTHAWANPILSEHPPPEFNELVSRLHALCVTPHDWSPTRHTPYRCLAPWSDERGHRVRADVVAEVAVRLRYQVGSMTNAPCEEKRHISRMCHPQYLWMYVGKKLQVSDVSNASVRVTVDETGVRRRKGYEGPGEVDINMRDILVACDACQPRK